MPAAKATRIARRQKRLKAEVDALLRSALPAPKVDLTSFKGVLRAVRTAGSLPLSPATRTRVRARLVTALATHLDGLTPKDFGATNINNLADIFVRMLERTNYSDYSMQELRKVAAGKWSRTPGLRSTFAGELFELLVINLQSLQGELRSLAAAQLGAVRKLTGPAIGGRFVNGDGVDIALDGTFGPVRRAADIVTMQGNARPKFIDAAYVSVFTPTDGSAPKLYFLVAVETKLPGAARRFRRQIGVALPRLMRDDGIVLHLDGEITPREFTRSQVIIDRAGTERAAITAAPSPAATAGYRTTDVGGYEDGFYRLGLAVDVQQLYGLVNLLFE